MQARKAVEAAAAKAAAEEAAAEAAKAKAEENSEEGAADGAPAEELPPPPGDPDAYKDDKVLESIMAIVSERTPAAGRGGSSSAAADSFLSSLGADRGSSGSKRERDIDRRSSSYGGRSDADEDRRVCRKSKTSLALSGCTHCVFLSPADSCLVHALRRWPACCVDAPAARLRQPVLQAIGFERQHECPASHSAAPLTLAARHHLQVREVELSFERQREKDRRAAEEKAAEMDRVYREHVRMWEKEERCVSTALNFPRFVRHCGH